MRNAEIKYYSHELDIHKTDVKQRWTFLKTIIGKRTNNLEIKMSFLIKDAIVTDNLIFDHEFNNFFVSIGPKLSHDLFRRCWMRK